MTEFLKCECTPSKTAEQQRKYEAVEVMVRLVNKKNEKTEQPEVALWYSCHSETAHVKEKPNNKG